MRTNRTLRSYRTLLPAILACLWSFGSGQAQMLVDDFNRPNSNTVGNGWTEYETISPSSVRVQNNALVLESNVAGRDFISKVSPGGYDAALANNSCKLEWSFNMRQNSLNPGGMTTLNHGLAMVLAGSHGNLLQGQGYAVVLGTTGTTVDPIRLVRYSNGLTHNNVLTNLITVGSFNDQYLAIRVTYEPTTGVWEMFYDHASFSFPNAELANTSAGTSNDATYTGTSLPYIGALWNHGNVNSTRSAFDNIRVPYECASRVDFLTASGSVNSTAGSVEIPLILQHPHLSNAANVTVDLASGDGSIINGAISNVVTFDPGASEAVLVLDIPFNGACIGDQQLIFDITGITGGSGSAFIGPVHKYYLTVTDDRSGHAQLLHESFETDGNGSRYSVNVAHASPSAGSYFLRGDNTTMTAAGGLSLTNTHGNSFIGGASLTGIAANAEAIITFNDLDIVGMSGVTIGLRAGARYATRYDQESADRDYLFVEANIDGTGWFTAGAFRSHKENPFVDGWFAHDTNLDGVGDGVRLSQNMQSFNFPVNVAGSYMDVRIRMRSTGVEEDIFFDDLQVAGTLCQPIYFSTSSGNETDAIWSNTRNGVGAAVSVDRKATLFIQDGHVITASGVDRQVKELTVEAGASFVLGGTTWEVHGDTLRNDGMISATIGGMRMISNGPAIMAGSGMYDLFDLAFNVPGGVEASSMIDIHGTLAIDAGVVDATSANIRLRSTINGTGRLGPVVGGADLLGAITMQRYIPAGATNWRFLGAPVAGATVQQWQDDFFTAGYPGSAYPSFYSPPGSGIHWPSVRWYDETHPGSDLNDGLLGATSSAMPLALGQGFAAWCGTSMNTTNAFTIDLTGAPNIAHTSITLPMSFTDTGVPAVDGFNLVSNPLPSPIAFSAISRGSDIVEAYWVYDPATGSTASWNGIVGTNGANGTIQSSQSFWLKANGPAVTTTVAEAAKVSGNTGGLFGLQSNELPMLRLKVSDDQEAFSDETVIVFGDGVPVHDDMDVLKLDFRHPEAPIVSSHSTDGFALAINMYGMPTTAVSIPLDIEVGTTGTYAIKVSDIGIIAGLSCVSLKDLSTGMVYPLSEGAILEFVIEAGVNDEPRFLVELSEPIQRGVTNVTCHGGSDGSVTVTVIGDPAVMTLMDVFSGVIDQQTGVTVTFGGLPADDYLLSVSDNGGCGDLVGAFTIEEPFAIDAEFTISQASCGQEDGMLEADVFGGNMPYVLEWNTGSQDEFVIGGAGDYILSVTDAEGCQWASEPLQIPAEEGPVAAFEIADQDIYPGQAVTFYNLSTNADTYVWDMGDGSIIQAQQVTYMFGLAGMQTVTLTATRGECSDVVSQGIMVIGATGIQENQTTDIHAWFDGNNINVRHDLNEGKVLTVELMDATGRVHARTSNPSGTSNLLIPAAGLSSGVWFVRVFSDQEQFSQRVVITR